MASLKDAIAAHAGATEYKLRSFATAQRGLAEDLGNIKAALGGAVETKEDREYYSAWRENLADMSGRGHARLKEAARDLKIINSTQGADGGLAIPKVVESRIFAAAGNLAPEIALCGVTPVTTTDYQVPFTVPNGGANSRGESDSVSASATSTFFSAAPSWAEIYTHTQVYSWAWEDIVGVENHLVREGSRQIAIELGRQIISGTGSGELLGVLGTTPSTSADDASPQRTQYQIQSVAAGATNSPLSGVYPDDMESLLSEFQEAYLNDESAAILMRRSSWATLNGDGTTAQVGGTPNWWGTRVAFSSSVGEATKGNYPVIAGSWARGYLLVQRGVTSVLLDPYSTKGVIQVMTRARYGGCPLDNRALKAIVLA